MASELIAVGDKIDLIDISRKETSEDYKSKILDIVDDKHIKISMPMKGGRVIPLEVGKKFRLWIYSKNVLYTTIGLIEERYRKENLFVLEITLETKLEKLQRREYYRLPCVIELDLKLLEEEEEEYINQLEKDEFTSMEARIECQDKLAAYGTNWTKGNIIDLSGGGARINSDIEFKKDDILKIKYCINVNFEPEYVESKAKVIEGFRVENMPYKYETRIEFIDLKKDSRDAIVRYIFDEERKKIQKEKGMS
ncbi:flagellar brake protein [Anaeromicropila herbilytica]|uniref:Flagellar protein n=1 Tax=Anaeromicropila herbilytica TaxID=2785025 RepID=A0A7R7EMI8_9FIRM|nr:flagellar brake protein [Anaeromicropila herbilytica]BCN31513.1 flagellar protein [Anaeromicropila herbilytica]